MTPPYSPTGETRERVYRYVRQRLENGQPPTIREVQEEFGFRAVETARQHLERLVAEGRLSKRAGRSRGYSLPGSEEQAPVIHVPLLGRVPAGGLEEAVEQQEGTVVMVAAARSRHPGSAHRADSGSHSGGRPGAGGGRPDFFALRVEGESMTGVGILSGDIIIVRAQPTARSGDVVVAMIGDEATVKTLRRTGRRIELWPENKRYKPIYPPADQLRILGKVIEVRRDLS